MFFLLTFSSGEQRDVFEYIYSRYKNLMLKKAYAILRDTMLAEDAVSEAFIRIYKNIHKIGDPQSGKTVSFIITITKNAALTMLQKESNEYLNIEDEDRQDDFDLENHVLSEISSGKIYELLNQLPEELKSVFLLKFAHDCSHRKIGELLGISENNVTVRLHRAKKKIADLLGKEGYLYERQ